MFATAKRAGKTTAAVYWPITACDPNIDHVINEYFFYLPDEDIVETFRRQGSDEVALQAVRENMPRFRYEKRAKGTGPNLNNTMDDFIMGCTCSLLRNEKPDVLALHNCYIDSTRHYYGAFAPEVYKALDQMDIWLGEVLQAMEHSALESPRFLPLTLGRSGSITKGIATAAELGKLGRYLDKTLEKIALELRQGNIDADPCGHNESDNACSYCEFASACHFMEADEGDHLELIRPIKPEEFWNHVDQIVGEEE